VRAEGAVGGAAPAPSSTQARAPPAERTQQSAETAKAGTDADSRARVQLFRLARLAPLKPDVGYRVRVLAINPVGLRGPPSAELHCQTLALEQE
jgi:hypothetical protein